MLFLFGVILGAAASALVADKTIRYLRRRCSRLTRYIFDITDVDMEKELDKLEKQHTPRRLIGTQGKR